MQSDKHYNTIFLKHKTGATLCDWEVVQPSRLTAWGITSPLAACRMGSIVSVQSVGSSTILRASIPRTITWCNVPGSSSFASLGIPTPLFAPNP
jgi:hypothetical protein